MPTKIEWGISQDRLQEIKDYWCRDEDNYSLAGRDQRDICELVAAVEELQAENERLRNYAEKLRATIDKQEDRFYNQ